MPLIRRLIEDSYGFKKQKPEKKFKDVHKDVIKNSEVSRKSIFTTHFLKKCHTGMNLIYWFQLNKISENKKR